MVQVGEEIDIAGEYDRPGAAICPLIIPQAKRNIANDEVSKN